MVDTVRTSASPTDRSPAVSSRFTPLRIVHCVRAPIGGIFRHVLDLAAEQAAQGHLVGIVLDSTSGGTFEADKIKAVEGVLKLGVVRLPMSRSIKPSDLVSAWRVYATLRDMAPDVLHGHGAKGGTFVRLVGTLIGFGRPVARIYTPHGGSLHYDANTTAGRAIFAIERGLEHLCDGIIHVSRYEAAVYRDKVGVPRCGVQVVVNGLRAEEFEPHKAGPEAVDFLMMGMLRDLKGPDVFIRALAAIRDRTGRTPTAAIVGDGPDQQRYRALVSELGLADAVRFHPPMPTRDGFALARAIVVPSRAESMPYIVLEATAAALPLVATRVGGIPEIIESTADRLVPPGQAEPMADAMLAILDDPEQAAAVAAAARAAMLRRFTVQAMTATTEMLYRGVLDRKVAHATGSGGFSLQPAE